MALLGTETTPEGQFYTNQVKFSLIWHVCPLKFNCYEAFELKDGEWAWSLTSPQTFMWHNMYANYYEIQSPCKRGS